MAYLGSEQDQIRAAQRLDDPDPPLRRAVAEGLAARGAMQPLLARAGDPAVYPVLLDVVTSGPADLDGFSQLVNLRPDQPMHEPWVRAVERRAAELNVRDLIEADRLLAAAGADDALRTGVLKSTADAPPPGTPPGDLNTLVLRLAPLLIQHGDAGHASDINERLDNPSGSPDLAAVRVTAAVRSSRFDLAARANGDPAAWIAELESMSEKTPDLAMKDRDEIASRFAESMSDDQWTALEAIGAVLQERAGSARTAESGDEHLP
jgi:hypothetical protein